MRGLKQRIIITERRVVGSHALRVRGLKPKVQFNASNALRVARSTRAWIETMAILVAYQSYLVARSTRAWIETQKVAAERQRGWCRTLYACVD